MMNIARRWKAAGAWQRVKLFAFSSAMLALGGGLASAANYYVATNGIDSGSGTLADPFRTLERAQSAMRAAGTANNGGTVYVRGGTYYRTNTFALTSADSGPSPNAPVVYLAYTNETPVIVGGLRLTNFQTYSGSIKVVNVSTQGFGSTIFRQLFFGGNRQWQARYPNYDSRDPYGAGWSYVDGEVSDMGSPQAGESKTSFTYVSGDVPRTWANPTNASVFIFPRYNWWNNIANISTIDAVTRVIGLKSPTDYTIRHGDRYYVQNVFEELDAPGEWYLNTNSMLYFWPASTVTAESVVAPLITNIVTLANGASNITFQGFTLTACEGTAITLNGTTNCLMAKNKILNVGNYNGSGIEVVGGFNNGVVGNDISYVGRHGIALSGGKATTLTSAANYAVNNYIHHTGVLYKEGVGIYLLGVGNRAGYNLIHDCPRFGIYFRGQNLTIEYNEVRDVMLETDDGGVIYSENTNWLESRGCVIRYNYFHDAKGWGFLSGVRGVADTSFGIYLDALTCGVDIIGNVVAHTSGPGLFLNGGSENRATNNIFYECRHGTGASGNNQVNLTGFYTNSADWSRRLDAFTSGYRSITNQAAWSSVRGMNVAPADMSYGANGYTMAFNYVFKNILVWTNFTATDLAYYCLRMEFDRNMTDDNTLFHYGQPVTLTHVPDYYLSLATWRGRGIDVNSITNNPMISNPKTGDFTLAANSPALALGFVQIPVGEIGPYQDALRASWPITQARGAREGFKILPSPNNLHPL